MDHTTAAPSPRTLELAQTLVRMDTVSENSNLALIHFVRDELQRLGVASRLTYNADRTKANLFATLGEGKPAGLVLSGHTDTVPWAPKCATAGCTAAVRPT
jgi:acetylornithine deacetylase